MDDMFLEDEPDDLEPYVINDSSPLLEEDATGFEDEETTDVDSDHPSETWKVILVLTVGLGLFVGVGVTGVVFVKSWFESGAGSDLMSGLSELADSGNDRGMGHAEADGPIAEGALWVGLSRLRVHRQTINTEISVDYRITRGKPRECVLVIEDDHRREFVDVTLGRSGTLQYDSRKFYGSAFGVLQIYLSEKNNAPLGNTGDLHVKRSGVLREGGTSTNATPPPVPLPPHQRAADWKSGKPWVSLSGFQQLRGGIGRGVTVDYEIAQGQVTSCMLVVDDGRGFPRAFPVTLKQRGTIRASILIVGAGRPRKVQCYLAKRASHVGFPNGQKPERYSAPIQLGSAGPTSRTP